MVDARTRAYLDELAKAIDANKRATDAAEEVCQCSNCIESRMKKEMSQCDKNRLLQYLPMKIIEPAGDKYSNFIPELSPNFEFWQSGRRRAF
jgi:hypothetical protein